MGRRARQQRCAKCSVAALSRRYGVRTCQPVQRKRERRRRPRRPSHQGRRRPRPHGAAPCRPTEPGRAWARTGGGGRGGRAAGAGGPRHQVHGRRHVGLLLRQLRLQRPQLRPRVVQLPRQLLLPRLRAFVRCAHKTGGVASPCSLPARRRRLRPFPGTPKNRRKAAQREVAWRAAAFLRGAGGGGPSRRCKARAREREGGWPHLQRPVVLERRRVRRLQALGGLLQRARVRLGRRAQRRQLAGRRRGVVLGRPLLRQPAPTRAQKRHRSTAAQQLRRIRRSGSLLLPACSGPWATVQLLPCVAQRAGASCVRWLRARPRGAQCREKMQAQAGTSALQARGPRPSCRRQQGGRGAGHSLVGEQRDLRPERVGVLLGVLRAPRCGQDGRG